MTASAGVMGSAQAVAPTFNVGALSPTVKSLPDVFSASGASTPNSFRDVLGFAVDANYRTASASTVKYALAGTGARLTHVNDLKLELVSGSNAVGSLPGSEWSLHGARIDLQSAPNPGDVSARISVRAGGEPGGGFRFSIAAVPEPAEWMQLVCGLVVVAFMARRRTYLAAG